MVIRRDVGAYTTGETDSRVNAATALANTAIQNATTANNNANTRLEKSKNGADIPDIKRFVENLGLAETVPNSRKINDKPLTNDVTLDVGDVCAFPQTRHLPNIPDLKYIGPFTCGSETTWAKGISVGLYDGDVGQMWVDSNAVLHARFLSTLGASTQQSIRGIPIGATIEWQSGAPISPGFAVNDGRAFDKSQYLELLKIFPDGVLPDDRGLFKRALDSSDRGSRNLDPGRQLGTIQNDAIRNIRGTFGAPTTELGQANNFATGPFTKTEIPGGRQSGHGGDAISFEFDVGRVVPVAHENRPINKSVIYITRIF
ncbi:hypothetical protein [Xenorhabdus bovienii]|nr:hypothetical protein [Xenorhabdus bovienii]